MESCIHKQFHSLNASISVQLYYAKWVSLLEHTRFDVGVQAVASNWLVVHDEAQAVEKQHNQHSMSDNTAQHLPAFHIAIFEATLDWLNVIVWQYIYDCCLMKESLEVRPGHFRWIVLPWIL